MSIFQISFSFCDQAFFSSSRPLLFSPSLPARRPEGYYDDVLRLSYSVYSSSFKEIEQMRERYRNFIFYPPQRHHFQSGTVVSQKSEDSEWREYLLGGWLAVGGCLVGMGATGGPWGCPGGALLGLSIGMSTGCDSNERERRAPRLQAERRRPLPLQTPWPLTGHGNFTVRTEIDGDPHNVGSVVWFHLWHPSPLEDLEETHPSLMRLIAIYNLEMLREFERIHPRHVFAENVSHEIPASILARGDYRGISFESIRFMFREVPQEPTPEQISYLYRVPIYFIYALRYPDILIHPTLTVDEQRVSEMFFHRYIEEPYRRGRSLEEIQQDPNIREMMYIQRERWAEIQIERFLRAHPGEQVALIFGHDHTSLPREFERANFRPFLRSVWREIEREQTYSSETAR